MKIYKQDLNKMAERNVTSDYIIFSCSLKDVGKSSRHGDDQEKTTKRSKMPKVNILLYLYFKSLCLFIFFFQS